MRRVLIALAILAVTASLSFAADQRPAMRGQQGMMGQMMHQNPEMMQQMRRNPQHLLMRAYHRNVMNFGHALGNVARQGETVPPQFARTAIAEMRRNIEEMEKYRAESMATLPAGMKGRGEMQKMMDEHLVNVKKELRQLEDLAKSDRIPSQEVLKHLRAMFEQCGDMGYGQMQGGAPYCGGGRGGYCGHGCNGKMMPMMQERRQMMQQMTERMKAQDAEMSRKVDEMKKAPRDQKMDRLAEIVAQLVQQRAEMTAHMERMQNHMMPAQQGYPQYAPPPPPNTPMFRNGQGPDDDDEVDMDMDEMEMDDGN